VAASPLSSHPPAESRILVVDDEPDNIHVLTTVLREKGYRTSVATNGRKALEFLGRTRPDLILLDVLMPELDGFETCRQIKASPETRDIPLIFLTAKSDTDDVVRGFDLGAVDYLGKPFNPHELLARVHTHLAMDRLRRENEKFIRSEAETARHRSVAQMVAGVAHEINTPLGIINTAADLITRRLSSPELAVLENDPEGRELLEDLRSAGALIARNVVRAHTLVQDFKKVSVDQITDVLDTVNLPELVTQTAQICRLTSRECRLEVSVVNEVPPERANWLGYPGSLSQVLLNLLSNVQRYAYPPGPGGRVVITVAAEEDGFRIEVRDFGKGIPPENLPRVFEPFFTTGRGQGGSGLGMSIAFTIVTAHLEGSISIDSEVGQGTTVTVRLPRAVAPPAG